MKAFLFDLDGVLVDSYHCWLSMINELLVSQGKPPLTQKRFDESWGQGPEADREMFYSGHTLQELLKWYQENFHKHVHLVKVEPDAIGTVRKLRGHGKKLGVASNSPTPIIEMLLQRAQLFDYFDAIVGVDQVKNAKPAPDLILKLHEQLNESISDCCYIGDSIYDQQAAKSAAILFIGYKRSGDKTIQTLETLLDFVSS